MNYGTYFFNRTAYSFGALDVPDCFLQLDSLFARSGMTIADSIANPLSQLAENLCRRMAHVDMNAHLIEASMAGGLNVFQSVQFVGTLVVAHFGACKSVLDATAMTLNDIHGLGLKGGNLDMKKGVFWSALSTANQDVETRLSKYRSLAQTVTDWRDEAVHRIPPITVASGKGDPEDIPMPKGEVRMCLIRGIGYSGLMDLLYSGHQPDTFGHPLHFHRLWRDQLLEICGIACDSIATTIPEIT